MIGINPKMWNKKNRIDFDRSPVRKCSKVTDSEMDRIAFNLF